MWCVDVFKLCNNIQTYLSQGVFEFQQIYNISANLIIRGGRFLGIPNSFSGSCDEGSVGIDIFFGTAGIYKLFSWKYKCGLINLRLQ